MAMRDCETTWNCTVSWTHDPTNTSTMAMMNWETKLHSFKNTWPHEHQHHGDGGLWNKTVQSHEHMTSQTPASRRWWTVKQNCTVSSIHDVTNTSTTGMMKCEANITVSGTHNTNTSSTAMMDCETTWNCTVSWRHDTTDTSETKLHSFMNTWRHEHQHHGDDELWNTHYSVRNTHYSVRNTRSVKQTLQCQEHTICKTNITVSGTHDL